jgi:hypothetical protein
MMSGGFVDSSEFFFLLCWNVVELESQSRALSGGKEECEMEVVKWTSI